MRSRARSLSRRAAALRLLLLPPRPRQGGLGVIVYPLDVNPYQELLYSAIRASGVECTVIYVRRRAHLGPLPFLVQVTLARMRGYRLLHLHWPQFALHFRKRHLPRLSLLNARLSLWYLGALGVRLVWTVHNAIPHEPETADDVVVSRMLARDAARKILHSAHTVEELAALGADTGRIAVIPHGTYSERYREADRADSRRRLHLPEAARIVMFFGQIRPYKGVEDLLSAWSEAIRTSSRDGPTPFLLIAGKCADQDERRRIERELSTLNGRFDEGFTPHDEVPLYFAASDVVALPFRRVTTSGSALLSLSLGRPIVAPRMGALRDLPPDVGYLYDHDNLVEALTQALTAAPADIAGRSGAARRYASSLSWDHVAAATIDVYRQAAVLGG